MEHPTSLTTNWREVVHPYTRASTGRSVWQVGSSFAAYFVLWAIAVHLSTVSAWLALLVAPLIAGYLLRIFSILHDCGHGAYFTSSKWCELVGTVCAVFVLTPYHDWRSSHSVHHAGSGNLDKRGVGDVWTLTREEYETAPPPRRRFYRIFRHPAFLLLASPTLIFIIFQRIPGFLTAGKTTRRSRWNTHFTTAGHALLVFAGAQLVGWDRLALVHGSSFLIASSVGVLLFYLEHQAEYIYWSRQADWTFVESSIRGSVFLKLPAVLQYFTGNVGYHHVHHLAPKIPNYRLRKCHESHPLFEHAPVVELGTIWRTLLLFAFDEREQRMLPRSFRYAYRNDGMPSQ
jgi:acyl-lipid omega-6 desaturase (Delta-12 desaturase)